MTTQTVCLRVCVCMCMRGHRNPAIQIHNVCVSVFTWDDDDALGLLDQLHALFHVHLSVCAGDLHWLARAGGGCAVATQDDVSQ